MPLNFKVPTNPRAARPVLQRFMQEIAAIAPGNISGRRRPLPPRSLIAQPGSLQALITWNSPENLSNVKGFNLYRDNELNRIQQISDPGTRQITVQLPASTPTMYYISAFNDLQESVKVPILATALSTSYVTSGTGGATGGTAPPLPPGYPNEPSGGGRLNFQNNQ